MTEQLRQSVMNWLKQFELLINQRAYDQAALLFAEDVFSFGTLQLEMSGLETLKNEQWRRVWPNIHEFKFGKPEIITDRKQAVIMCRWSSLAKAKNLEIYHREGRASLVLQDFEGNLKCVHSHLSMMPNTNALL
jgi:putative methionine-R-sulfoxide reductase with GAF domain